MSYFLKEDEGNASDSFFLLVKLKMCERLTLHKMKREKKIGERKNANNFLRKKWGEGKC